MAWNMYTIHSVTSIPFYIARQGWVYPCTHVFNKYLPLKIMISTTNPSECLPVNLLKLKACYPVLHVEECVPEYHFCWRCSTPGHATATTSQHSENGQLEKDHGVNHTLMTSVNQCDLLKQVYANNSSHSAVFHFLGWDLPETGICNPPYQFLLQLWQSLSC